MRTTCGVGVDPARLPNPSLVELLVFRTRREILRGVHSLRVGTSSARIFPGGLSRVYCLEPMVSVDGLVYRLEPCSARPEAPCPNVFQKNQRPLRRSRELAHLWHTWWWSFVLPARVEVPSGQGSRSAATKEWRRSDDGRPDPAKKEGDSEFTVGEQHAGKGKSTSEAVPSLWMFTKVRTDQISSSRRTQSRTKCC